MSWLHTAWDFISHFDENINEISSKYGAMMYAIMFLIIFCETALVITPVLPGDSMIFAASALAARDGNTLNVHLIAALMVGAAFSGDTLNYFIGAYIGPKVYRKNYKLLNRKNLNRSKQFYKKYGKRTIMYARFIPIIRTFAPFVAGVSEMNYKQFMQFNLAEGFLWVVLYAYGGYFFGNVSFVKKHFELTALSILVITLAPAIVAVVKAKLNKGKSVH